MLVKNNQINMLLLDVVLYSFFKEDYTVPRHPKDPCRIKF